MAPIQLNECPKDNISCKLLLLTLSLYQDLILDKTVTLTILTPEPMLTKRYGKSSEWSKSWKTYGGFCSRWNSNTSLEMFLKRKLQPLIRHSISSSLSTLQQKNYAIIKLILQSHSFINDSYWHYQSMKRKYDDVGEIIIVPRIDNNREY